MQKRINPVWSRRNFVFTVSGMIAGLPLLGQSGIRESRGQEKILTAELSKAERERIKKSVMAEDLQEIFGSHKYSCAESILMASLHYLNEPEDLVWAAAGFGGGMGQKDLCGFLTGGIMGIGFAAGKMEAGRKQAKDYAGKAVKKYWTWWEENAPLRCRNIRTPESGSGICLRLGKRAAAEVESLIESRKG